MAYLVARSLKNLPAKLETLVPSQGREDPLEKEMATYSRVVKSHGQRSLAGYGPRGHKESDTAERCTHTVYIASLGRGHRPGTPLCSKECVTLSPRP